MSAYIHYYLPWFSIVYSHLLISTPSTPIYPIYSYLPLPATDDDDPATMKARMGGGGSNPFGQSGGDSYGSLW